MKTSGKLISIISILFVVISVIFLITSIIELCQVNPDDICKIILKLKNYYDIIIIDTSSLTGGISFLTGVAFSTITFSS